MNDNYPTMQSLKGSGYMSDKLMGDSYIMNDNLVEITVAIYSLTQ